MSGSSGRVLVGVSSNFLYADWERPLFRGKTLQYFEERMLQSVWRSGAMPVPLPHLHDDAALRDAVQHIDGLLLTGGADVAPGTYGETPMRDAWKGDAGRDAYEARLVELMVARGRPVLAICRGIQLVNAAMGGTLYQDIGTQVDGALVHRDWHRYDHVGHPIRVTAGSLVSDLYGGATALEVNSIHHQAIKDLAPGFRATAWAPDEIIEAFEWVDEQRWIVGVQWHPEWLEPDRVAMGGEAPGWANGKPLFDALVTACRQR